MHHQITEAARRSGLTASIPDLHRYLSQCVEAHLVPLLERAHQLAQHRQDPSRCMPYCLLYHLQCSSWVLYNV